MINSWEQWWDEDWHVKTKTPEQECISSTYNINSTIIINIKIIYLDTWMYVSFHWWSCMFGLYTNFFIIPEMYVAVFIIVQLCTQFPVRESGGAGLLYCQSMILDVSVPDGIPPPTCLQWSCMFEKNQSSTVGGLLWPYHHVVCKFLSVCLLPYLECRNWHQWEPTFSGNWSVEQQNAYHHVHKSQYLYSVHNQLDPCHISSPCVFIPHFVALRPCM